MIPSPFHGIFSSAARAAEKAQSTVASHTPTGGHADPAAQGKHRHTSVTGDQSRPGVVGQVALDIFEYDNYYILKAPIAGVRLSDIDIEVNENIITIRGIRRQTDTIQGDRYYLRECFWGEFERSVTLPCSIDARKVKATFNKENVLKVIVPKEEKIRIIRIND